MCYIKRWWLGSIFERSASPIAWMHYACIMLTVWMMSYSQNISQLPAVICSLYPTHIPTAITQNLFIPICSPITKVLVSNKEALIFYVCLLGHWKLGRTLWVTLKYLNAYALSLAYIQVSWGTARSNTYVFLKFGISAFFCVNMLLSYCMFILLLSKRGPFSYLKVI